MTTTLVLAPRVADAAPVDCAAGPDWTVATEQEFNDAIDCYNAATSVGAYSITFNGDIASSMGHPLPATPINAAFHWITQSDPNLNLVIDGGGFSAWGGLVPTTTIGIADTGASGVTITNIFITAGRLTGVHAISSTVVITDSIVTQNGNGVMVDGSSVSIIQSVISENGGSNVEGIGVIVYGLATIRSSVIDSNDGIGVRVNTGLAAIVDSSIVANEFGGVVNFGNANDPEPEEPVTTIATSTIADNGFSSESLFGGVHAGVGRINITTSTITGNGNTTNASVSALAPGSVDARLTTIFDNFGSVEVLGAVELFSTIAERCGVGVIDGGRNVGGCFGSATANVEPLGDNGCLISTPQGCPATFMPTADSVALGRGDCTDGFSLDQVGQARTPVGPGCDAGAVERPGFVPGLRGDVNCDDQVNIVDALVIAQFDVNIRSDGGACPLAMPATELNPARGDFNFDGRVNIVDALVIARCDAGILSELCEP